MINLFEDFEDFLDGQRLFLTNKQMVFYGLVCNQSPFSG